MRGRLPSRSLPEPRGGASQGGARRRPTRGLRGSAGMRPRPLPQIPALWEVCPAPPSVRKSHAPCQRSHASIPDATPNPGKPLLLASRGPAPLRRLLRPPSSEVGPRLRDLGLFLPLKLPWTSEIPSLLQSQGPAPKTRPLPLAAPPWECPLDSSRAPTRCQQSRAPVSCSSASSSRSPAGVRAPASDRKS